MDLVYLFTRSSKLRKAKILDLRIEVLFVQKNNALIMYTENTKLQVFIPPPVSLYKFQINSVTFSQITI
jgi:hypothetical protein